MTTKLRLEDLENIQPGATAIFKVDPAVYPLARAHDLAYRYNATRGVQKRVRVSVVCNYKEEEIKITKRRI